MRGTDADTDADIHADANADCDANTNAETGSNAEATADPAPKTVARGTLLLQGKLSAPPAAGLRSRSIKGRRQGFG